jgi:hypothetical protein
MELCFDTLDTSARTKAQLSGVLFEQFGLYQPEACFFKL